MNPETISVTYNVPLEEQTVRTTESLFIPSSLLVIPKKDEERKFTKNKFSQSTYDLEEFIDPLVNKECMNREYSENSIQTQLYLPKIYSEKNRKKKEDMYNYDAFYLGHNDPLLTSWSRTQKQLPILTQQISALMNTSGLDQPMKYITPDMLPVMALPVVAFIEQLQPHVVIGCDRGGRLFSVAVHAAWKTTKAATPFPTLDGKIHFARISKSEDEAVLQQKIDDIVASAKKFGEHRGIVLEDDEQLRVLFIDDWVVGGGTKNLAERLMFKYNASTFFAVMTGRNADVSGDPEFSSNVSWHDNPTEIGVNYLSTLRRNTASGNIEEGLGAVIVKSTAALRNRDTIHLAAKKLAATI